MHMRKIGKMHSVIRTSVEMDKAPKPEEGTIRNVVSLSGLLITPTEKGDETMVSMMCISDMIKPLSKESVENLEKMMLERVHKFRSACQE